MKMTEDDKRQLILSARRAPKSRWTYLLFAFPLFAVIFGGAAHLVLFIWLRSHGVELWLHLDGRTVRVWDSAVVKELVLSTSLLVIGAFGLLALLADIAYRQAHLLRKAAQEMDWID